MAFPSPSTEGSKFWFYKSSNSGMVLANDMSSFIQNICGLILAQVSKDSKKLPTDFDQLLISLFIMADQFVSWPIN